MEEDQTYLDTSGEGAQALSCGQDGATCSCQKLEGDANQQQLVLKRLLAAHQQWFDVFEDYAFAGRVFPGYAEFRSHGEKYVLVKKAKLWEVDAFEYLFFAFADVLDAKGLDEWVSFVTTQAIAKVTPDSSHMTSYLSLVLIAKGVDKEAARALRRARFHKEFKFGLNGWVDMRLAAVDLGESRVITNSMGKKMKPLLEANSGFSVEQGKRKRIRQR